MRLRNRRALAALSLLCVVAACDEGEPLAPSPDGDPVELARLECTVTVASGAMWCGPAAPDVGGAQGIIVGRQGEHVLLEATNHAFNDSDNVFSIDVTVQNLLPQPMGTTDGTALDDDGVRVFFYQDPVAGDGSGRAVSVINHTGTDFFTGAGQKYFQWDEVLSRDETSDPSTWEFSVDPLLASFRFTVLVAAAVPFANGYVDVTPRADTLGPGQTVALGHTVRSAVGVPLVNQSVVWGTSDEEVATVSASGLVTAVAPGTATITATQGALGGSATISVCPSLAVGQAYVVANLNATPSLCLGAGEYTLVAVNTTDNHLLQLSVTGAGIVPVSGPPSPARLPGAVDAEPAPAPERDYAFESRLRAMERREAARRPVTGDARRPGGARMAITPGVPAVGALMTLNVNLNDYCSTSTLRTGRVMAVGTHIIIIADIANPAGGLTAAQYAAIADSFDARIYPAVTAAFGTPSDRDANGRVIAFYTSAVNALTDEGMETYKAGYFFSRDLYSALQCHTGNAGELLYMLAADPAGEVNGNVRTVEFIQNETLWTLAHELEHLINASRRMLVNTPWNGKLEEPWLDEGLAHMAEELVFYHAAGLSPGADLDAAVLSGGVARAAFSRYGLGNYLRLARWLEEPETTGPFWEFSPDDDVSTRGATWAFLRYAADRHGGSEPAFWRALINTGNVGVDNLHAVLGTDPFPWLRDFSAAMYADNAFGAVSPPAVFRQPSWNFRSVYGMIDLDAAPGCTCSYPLRTRNPANGVTETFTLFPSGGSGYVRMGVPSGAFAGIRTAFLDEAPPSGIRLVVIRRK